MGSSTRLRGLHNNVFAQLSTCTQPYVLHRVYLVLNMYHTVQYSAVEFQGRVAVRRPSAPALKYWYCTTHKFLLYGTYSSRVGCTYRTT
jgi:hypothetical protein